MGEVLTRALSNACLASDVQQLRAALDGGQAW